MLGVIVITTKIIQRIEGPGIKPGATSNWSNELLLLPATVPSSIAVIF